MSRLAATIPLLVTLAAPLPAGAPPLGGRSALLLGNWSYDGLTLADVSLSLDAVERALASRGFRVSRRENLGEKEQESTVEDFASSIATNGVALVYYAGLAAHVERSGRFSNHLRPVGASIRSDGDYRSRGLDVAKLIETLRNGSGARVSLVFLDACRESPIKPETDTVRGGLRAFEIDPDVCVMFAAGSERVLSLAAGDSPSAFATALARHVRLFDNSVKRACEAIADELDAPWFDGATEGGIGAPPSAPLAGELREGRTAGEGLVNSVGMTFRWCPAGTFTMGSKRTNSAATRDRKAVEVTLSSGFWMGEHEVTQREYGRVMRKNAPRGFTEHKNAPFWGVSEPKQVTQFCDRLGELERKAGALPDGWEYVCPTEAEWEYACRAESTTPYCFGDSIEKLGEYANFADGTLWSSNPDFYWSERRANDGIAEALAPVGSYRPNRWGLRDMHGNVAELVADHLLPELPGGTDPLARAEKNGTAQIRGGAWCSVPLYCESSFRNALSPGSKLEFVGFRIALKKVK